MEKEKEIENRLKQIRGNDFNSAYTNSNTMKSYYELLYQLSQMNKYNYISDDKLSIYYDLLHYILKYNSRSIYLMPSINDYIFSYIEEKYKYINLDVDFLNEKFDKIYNKFILSFSKGLINPNKKKINIYSMFDDKMCESKEQFDLITFKNKILKKTFDLKKAV